MRITQNRPTSAGIAVISALLMIPSTSRADTPNCADISGGAPIIYGAGATGPENLVGDLAVQLEKSTHPIYVVYQDKGSCTGVYAMTGISSASITGSAYYWPTDTGAKTACNLTITGDAVDFATMDVGAINCPSIGGDESMLADLVELQGPVDPVNAIVPVGSSQTVISSEAFYLIYGLGPSAGIAPWTNADPTYYQHRDSDSGTQTMIALASGIPVGKFQGTDAGGTSALITNLAGLANPEDGIGFATANGADAHRDVVRNLAWQQAGQDVGYWPDSDATTFDKANVRDGQYDVWDAIHFYAYEGATTGSFMDADVKVLADYFDDVALPAGAPKTITEVATEQHVIPECAMHVARDTDLGPMYLFQSAQSCDCYFDFTVTGATTCASCDDSTPCSGTDVCRLGFCEAR